jgi:hypothetical protein
MNIESLIKEKSSTETGQELVKLLTNIWDDKEFILGCLVDLQTDEQKQKLIDFINEENETDSDVITLASLDIADGIEI